MNAAGFGLIAATPAAAWYVLAITIVLIIRGWYALSKGPPLLV